MWKLVYKKKFKHRNKIVCMLGMNVILIFCVLILFPSTIFAFGFSSWDQLLKENINSKVISGIKINAFNYKNIKSDPLYLKLIKDLRNYNLANLKTKNDKLAFWINVYNIMAVKMVLDNYPIKSIKDLDSLFKPVWKKEVGAIGGTIFTLNDIEHKILRQMGESRIHVAIVCASVSCPDLRKEAYKPEKLDEQLDDQLTKFLANQGKGLKIDLAANKLYLSSIFKWFEEDFESNGGVVSYLTNYVDSRYKLILKSGKLKIRYLIYDWGLNE